MAATLLPSRTWTDVGPAIAKRTTPKELTLVAEEGLVKVRLPRKKDILDHLRKMGYANKKFSKAGIPGKHDLWVRLRIKGNEVYPKGHFPSGNLNTIRQPRFVLLVPEGNDVVGAEIMRLPATNIPTPTAW